MSIPIPEMPSYPWEDNNLMPVIKIAVLRQCGVEATEIPAFDYAAALCTMQNEFW
jgi:hypothetical protein